MENKVCEKCGHFRRHHIKYKQNYCKSAFGHYVFPRIKLRKTTTTACIYYKSNEKNGDIL